MLKIAVDYDQTLVFNDDYGETVAFNDSLIAILKERKEKGDKLILFTCREGEWLQEAIKEMEGKGLTFDSINEDLPEVINKTRKPKYDILIDDRAIPPYNYFTADVLEQYAKAIKSWNFKLGSQTSK